MKNNIEAVIRFNKKSGQIPQIIKINQVFQPEMDHTQFYPIDEQSGSHKGWDTGDVEVIYRDKNRFGEKLTVSYKAIKNFATRTFTPDQYTIEFID